MYLLPILIIIRTAGESVKDLAKHLGVSNEYASKIATLLEREGSIRKVRSGKNVLLFPMMDSPLTKALLMLQNAASQHGEGESVDLLVGHTGNLRLISALSQGKRDLPELLLILGCSRPTFYRMLSPYGPNNAGIIRITGKKEKVYELDTEHPYHGHLAELAGLLFPEETITREPTVERKIKVTSLRPRIILYVSYYLSYRDRPVSTGALTQEGVAQGLWTTQQIISKELKRLVGLGILNEIRIHIKDKKRRYKTYNLTDLGIEELEGINTTLSTMNLKILDFDGDKNELKISEIPGMYKSKVTLVEVLNYLSKEKVFDCVGFQKGVESRRVSEFISNFQRLAELNYFFGRVKETEKFREWLDNDRANFLMIKGLAGIGKTTFLARIIQEQRRRYNLFFYTINEWSTLGNVLRPLAGFLEKMKREQMKDILSKQGDEPDIEEIVLVLARSFKDSRALLIFDDVHKADERIELFFKALVRGNLPSGVKIVLSGRETPSIYDRRDVFVRGQVQEMELTGLDQTTSEQLLARRGIDRSEFEDLYKMTDGHPLALELIDKMDGFSNRNLNLFIKEEIVPKLSQHQGVILRLASVFRYPFPSVVFSVLQESFEKEDEKQAIELVEELVSNSFLIKSGDSYRIGDIFREFFYNSMDKNTSDELHMIAARFYNQMDTDEDRLEVFYHLAAGGRENDALEYLNSIGEGLLQKGMTHEIGEVLARIERKGLSKKTRVHFHYYNGVYSYVEGDWDVARKRFNQSIKLCNKPANKIFIPRAELRSGWIQANQGDRLKGIGRCKKALRIAVDQKSPEVASDTCRDLAMLYIQNDNTAKAANYSKKLKVMMKVGKNRQIRMNSFLVAALLALKKNEINGGKKIVSRGLKICELTGNNIQRLRFLDILGELESTGGEWKKALETCEKQIQLARSVGETYPRALALARSGQCLIQLGENEEAESRLYEALHYFNQFNERRMKGMTEGLFKLLE